jgi:hypothetical protein
MYNYISHSHPSLFYFHLFHASKSKYLNVNPSLFYFHLFHASKSKYLNVFYEFNACVNACKQSRFYNPEATLGKVDDENLPGLDRIRKATKPALEFMKIRE